MGGSPVKWGAQEFGTPALVTYALVPAPMSFDGARNCATVVPMNAMLEANRIGRAEFNRELAAAFAAWSDVAGLNFELAEPAIADILIGAQEQSRGRAFTNVAHAPSPDPSVPGSILRSVICLNPAAGWKVGFDGHLDVYDLRYSLTHEIGHAIGLDHPGVPGQLMDFRYREAFASLQEGDRAGAIDLYGPRLDTAQAPIATNEDLGAGVLLTERALGLQTRAGRVSAEGD